MSRGLPPLVDATVVQQLPDAYRLLVSIDQFGGQIPFMAVDVLIHGARDLVRGRWPPLPAPGTRGLVAFTRGDDRPGRWIGATAPSLPDSAPHGPASGYIDYAAHYGGGWDWIGQDGTTATAWPDGSAILASASGAAMPAPTRHVLDPAGYRVAQPFTAAQRLPSGPAAPFAFLFTHATGAQVGVTASGAVALTAASGQPVTLGVAGGASLTIAADGSIILTDAHGEPAVLTGDLRISGDVFAGYGTASQVGLQTHTHGGVSTGGGNTGPPNEPS